jgi:hypothetical protein
MSTLYELGYIGSSFFIQLVYAGAALGGVIIGVQQLQLWGTGWARRDDVAWELLGVGFCCASDGPWPVYHMRLRAARQWICANGYGQPK